MIHRMIITGGCLTAVITLAGCGTSRQSNAATSSPGSAARVTAKASEREVKKVAEAHAHFSAGVIHEMNDEREAALTEYHKAAIADLADEALVLDVSRRLAQAKKLEDALSLVSQAAALRNASGLIFARLGQIYSQLGRQEEAIKANRTAISRSPDGLPGYHNLFVTYVQTKRNPDALAVLDEAARQPDTDCEFLLGLAELYLSLAVQMPSEKAVIQARALKVLNRAEALASTNPALQITLADLFNLLGESRKAAQIYSDVLKKMPDIPLAQERLRAKLAEIYLRGPDRKKAAEQLEAIVRQDPTNAQAYYLLGSIAFEEKKNEEAVDNFRKTILLKPEFEQAYYDLATAQLNLGKTDQALATLESARKKFSPNFVMEFLTGMALTREKSFAQALQHYTSAEVIAQATEPKRLNEFFYFQLGATCERKGDYEQAEQYFERSLQLAPNFAEALNYYGYMLADRSNKLEKAHDMIQKALKLEPKNAAFLDSMGWVLFRLNRPAEALDYIQQALALSEEPDATVYEHLGDIYAALNQQEKAREAWQKSVSIEPSDAVKRKLENSQPLPTASSDTSQGHAGETAPGDKK